MTGRLNLDRARAESFGAVAADYERLRPDYPPALFDDLVAQARPVTALDVGCGTGKAARALIARGVDVLGLEPDPRMAGLARGLGVPVEVARVERWDARGRRFDLLVSAQAWHWVDPVLGPAVAAGVLRPGGVLALFWNYGRLDPAVQRALDAVYAEHAPELLSSSAQRGAAASLAQIRTDVAASGRFAAVERRDYPWQRSYPAADYAALLTTHSDHRQLPPGQLERLVAAVRAELERHGGRAVVRYRTELILAHTPAPEPVAP